MGTTVFHLALVSTTNKHAAFSWEFPLNVVSFQRCLQDREPSHTTIRVNSATDWPVTMGLETDQSLATPPAGESLSSRVGETLATWGRHFFFMGASFGTRGPGVQHLHCSKAILSAGVVSQDRRAACSDLRREGGQTDRPVGQPLLHLPLSLRGEWEIPVFFRRFEDDAELYQLESHSDDIFCPVRSLCRRQVLAASPRFLSWQATLKHTQSSSHFASSCSPASWMAERSKTHCTGWLEECASRAHGRAVCQVLATTSRPDPAE